MVLEKLTKFTVLNSEHLIFIFGGQTKRKKKKKADNNKNKNTPKKDSVTNDVTSDSTDTVTNDTYRKRS